MSKLSNMIEAHQTGRVRTLPSKPSVISIEDELSSNIHLSCIAKREYLLSVAFKVKGYAADDTKLAQLQNMARRQILHEVFSEFQPLLRRIELSLYDLDLDEARAALAELDIAMRW